MESNEFSCHVTKFVWYFAKSEKSKFSPSHEFRERSLWGRVVLFIRCGNVFVIVLCHLYKWGQVTWQVGFDFKHETMVSFHCETKTSYGRVTKQWYVGDKSIAFLRYRPSTGQVGIISIDKNYRRHGLGKYMLDIVVNDTLECGQSEKVHE